VKGITDGHLWLSRALANRGQFPAIDVIQSISRVRGDVTDAEQSRAARRVLALLALYNEIEDLVNIGAYVAGANVDLDVAVNTRPKILEYLKQEPNAASNLLYAKQQLMELVAWIDQIEKSIRSQKGKKPAA